jgi:hypothetical protein
VASVWTGEAPKLGGFGNRRWPLPVGALQTAGPNGPELAQPAAGELRDFINDRHTESIVRRRRVLEQGLRLALFLFDRSARVTNTVGGLEVDTGGRTWHVSFRPRPASLLDMHAAAGRAPVGQRLMISATPRGKPEREALHWLADEAQLPHRDEGLLLTVARDLVAGTL